MRNALPYIIGIILGFLLVWCFLLAIDKHLQNQDKMLCESAKISGNEIYLEKCELYYQTNNIKDLK